MPKLTRYDIDPNGWRLEIFGVVICRFGQAPYNSKGNYSVHGGWWGEATYFRRPRFKRLQ